MIYSSLRGLLGGDGKNYSLAVGTHEEAKLYARSMHYARIRPDGTIETGEGIAPSLTKAMEDVVGSTRDPWGFWQVERTGDRLDSVRQRYLDRVGR